MSSSPLLPTMEVLIGQLENPSETVSALQQFRFVHVTKDLLIKTEAEKKVRTLLSQRYFANLAQSVLDGWNKLIYSTPSSGSDRTAQDGIVTGRKRTSSPHHNSPTDTKKPRPSSNLKELTNEDQFSKRKGHTKVYAGRPKETSSSLSISRPSTSFLEAINAVPSISTQSERKEKLKLNIITSRINKKSEEAKENIRKVLAVPPIHQGKRASRERNAAPLQRLPCALELSRARREKAEKVLNSTSLSPTVLLNKDKKKVKGISTSESERKPIEKKLNPSFDVNGKKKGFLMQKVRKMTGRK